MISSQLFASLLGGGAAMFIKVNIPTKTHLETPLNPI